LAIISIKNKSKSGSLLVGNTANDPTRGLFAGGNTGAVSNVIDYVTISTLGNATDFGDLTVSRRFAAGCASSTRGLFAGGIDSSNNLNTIDYVTIDTTGNAIDFGDLTGIARGKASCSSSTRGIFTGGYSGAAYVGTIDYVTIATTGNATNFGNLITATYKFSGCG
jgi:hypothetical protein